MHPCDNLEMLLRTLQPPRRNHFFYGKRMDVQHFQLEQDYGKLKQWMLNRLTFGRGVVCGLRVSVDGQTICVDPGFAIDGLGREIVVPLRACIDPLTQEGGCCAPCCSETGTTPAPLPNPDSPAVGATGAQPAGAAGPAAQPATQPGDGVFTLWVCYKECRTDYEPVLVSDCGTREQCAPGTTVETFCLKVTPGLPPLQGDPDWCAKLWPKPQPTQPGVTSHVPPDLTHLGAPGAVATPDGAFIASALGRPADAATATATQSVLTGRRHLLCELFSGGCDVPEGDPCVPLAVLLLRDKRIAGFEVCAVRPRVYSNAVLLDLILCLADKIDECCGEKPPVTQLMRVKSVEFLGGRTGQEVIATVQSPLDITRVPIQRSAKAIRVVFTQAFDQGANKPTAPGLNDPNPKRRNFLVAREPQAAALPYVPGKLTIEAPDTLRWEMERDSPAYDPTYQGLQKGPYRLSIFGDPDAASGRVPVADTHGAALDGEPMAPAGGAMSGDGSAGGTFTLLFVVGG